MAEQAAAAAAAAKVACKKSKKNPKAFLMTSEALAALAAKPEKELSKQPGIGLSRAATRVRGAKKAAGYKK